MDFPGMRLTADGMNVLAQGLAGSEIRFTKGQLGDGDFNYDSETVVTMTALKSPKLDMPISGREVAGDGVAVIKTQVINANLLQGFRAKEHGIFAINPATGKEILYSYCNVGNEYSFIPAGTYTRQINATLAYLIEIQDCQNITFNIDWDFAYVSQAEFDALSDRFRILWQNFLIPDSNIVAQILNRTYIHSGNTSADDGLPSQSEIESILKRAYSHIETPKTPYTPDIPDSADIEHILLNF